MPRGSWFPFLCLTLLVVGCGKRGDSVDYELIQLPVQSQVRCIERAGDSIVVGGGEQEGLGFVMVLDTQLNEIDVATSSLRKEVYDIISFQGRWYMGLRQVEIVITESLEEYPHYWWDTADWVNTLHQQPFRRFAQTSDALVAICGGELAFGVLFQTYDTAKSWNPLEFDHELRALAAWETKDEQEFWLGGNGWAMHSSKQGQWDTLDFRDKFVVDFVPIATGRVRALTYDGQVWFSGNAGESWSMDSKAPTGTYANRMVRSDAGEWFIAANNGRLGYSSNEGSAWKWFILDDEVDLLDLLVLKDEVVFTSDQGALVRISLSEFR